MSNSNLVFLSKNNIPLTTSLLIAEALERPHEGVIKLCRNHEDDLNEFGRVAFQIHPFKDEAFQMPRESDGGFGIRRGCIKPVTVAYLNEQQATMLVCFMTNSPKVVKFKVALVKAFFEMKKLLAEQSGLYTPDEIAAIKDKSLRQGYAIAMSKIERERVPAEVHYTSHENSRAYILDEQQYEAIQHIIHYHELFKPSLLKIAEVLSDIRNLPLGQLNDAVTEPAISINRLKTIKQGLLLTALAQ